MIINGNSRIDPIKLRVERPTMNMLKEDWSSLFLKKTQSRNELNTIQAINRNIHKMPMT